MPEKFNKGEKFESKWAWPDLAKGTLTMDGRISRMGNPSHFIRAIREISGPIPDL
ncbi:MAG: hypothetical protein ABSG78_07550 [Verrucomicrobiota bacterium]|jgi:hypothetical protein